MKLRSILTSKRLIQVCLTISNYLFVSLELEIKVQSEQAIYGRQYVAITL
jgi:hypothetical protein